MSRLFESTLTGKISKALLECENEVENKEPEKEEEVLTESAKLNENRPGYEKSEKIADFLIAYDPYEFRNSYEGEDDYAKKGKLIVDINRDNGEAAKQYIQDIIDSGEASEEQIKEAKEILKLFEEDITPEELEKEDEENKKHNKKAIEDKIAELQLAIQDGVADDEKEAMEKEIAELENHLNESGYGRVHALEEGWSGTIKSGGALRQAIRDAGEDPSIEDCRAVLDALKASCEEAKTLTNDEYYQNGFQSVIDDIEMIYDDEDLTLDNVDWELDGFYDWCDGADLWCDLGESNINEAYKADDGQYPPYRFSEEDADYFRNLLGSGFKVDIRNSSAGDAPNGTMDISLDSKWVSGFMSSTRELDQEIDKYFSEKNPELEVHRNNTGMTLWLGEKSKKEGSVNESAEGIAEFWEKFDNGEIKIGDTFANGITLLDANKAKDYILVDRGYEYVAAWAPELSGEDLVWGQGHYFDDKSDAEAYFKGKINECAKSKKLTEADDMDYYGEGIFGAIEDALNDAGFDVTRYTDAGVLTRNIGWEVSKDGGYTQLDCPGSWYDPKYDKNSDEYEGGDDDEDFDECDKVVNESVSVVASDGSTVDTQDAASVAVDNNTVSVTNGQTTVTITSTPSEPALDIPQEEPVEEVPAEEIVPEEPIEEVPTEEPVEDEVIEEADEEPEVSIIDGANISVIKNQGNVYMVMLKDTEGNEKYWVCENYDASNNEADEAVEYASKEEADKDYFERVGLEPVEA